MKLPLINEHGTHRPPAANTPEGDWSVLLGQLWEWAWGLSSEVITAWATVFIAGCALWVARKQAQAARQQVEDMREHNRLSVTPLLTISLSQNVKDKNIARVSYKLLNAGIGPAIIESCSLFFEGKEISSDEPDAYNRFLENLAQKFLDTGSHPKLSSVRMSSGRTVAANQEFEILGFNMNNSPLHSEIEYHTVDNLDFIIKYHSIYKDKLYILKMGKRHN